MLCFVDCGNDNTFVVTCFEPHCVVVVVGVVGVVINKSKTGQLKHSPFSDSTF